MKILRIRFKNINSLKGEHTIDFTQPPLSAAGLFAITGPTGSGKTTILDVITLALFSRIPRVTDLVTRGFIEKTGLLLTRNMPDAFAEVTYNCKEGTFISQWSISTNRNGKLRDYDMQISDADDNLFPLKKSEVPAKNESLIGLNFDQFVKAIILAQGDFAAFLKAKGDERGRLLEKVTGTWIYRELGKAAYLKNKDHGQRLEVLQSQENARRDQLMEEDDFKALLESVSQSDKLLLDYKAQILRFDEQEKLKEEMAGLSRTISDHENKFQAVQEKLKGFLEVHGQRMEKHERLLPHQKNLWEWNQMNKTLNEQQDRLKAIENGLQQCRDEDAAIRKEVAGLTGSEQSVSEALESFQKRVLGLQKQLGEAASLSRNAAATVLADAKKLSLSLSKIDPADAARQLAEIMNRHGAELRRMHELLDDDSLQDPAKKMTVLRNVAETLQLWVSESRMLQSQQKQLEKQEREQKETTAEIAHIPQQIQGTQAKQKQEELQLLGLQKDKTIRDLSASLEEHRKKLHTGEPCPLCGSTEHPYSEGAPAMDDELDERIKTSKNTNDALKKEINALESTLLLKTQQLEKVQKSIAELADTVKRDQEKVIVLQNDLPEEYRNEEPEKTTARVKTEMKHIENYVLLADTGEKLKMLEEKVRDWNTHFGSAARLGKELKSIFGGADVLAVTRNFHERLTRNATRQKSLQEERGTLTEKHLEDEKAFRNLHAQLISELSGYDSPGEAMKDLLDDAAYKALQLTREGFKKEIDRIQSALKVHMGNLKELEAKDVKDTLEEIQHQRSQTAAQLEKVSTERDILISRKSFHEKTLQEMQALQEEIQQQKKQNEKWVLLNKYIGDAEGKRFSTFAQELTLHQLVQRANKRLLLLNERYILGNPEEGEDDSLVVVDTHMGDMRRSVRSLSGGESFLVSLSLALALSDLAAHKVEIKSLFIDEGFGSLDKFTLDQTMDTLEKLQYETSKTIGVISHVEAMQERITTQIKLEKGGQGCSSLEVV